MKTIFYITKNTYSESPALCFESRADAEAIAEVFGGEVHEVKLVEARLIAETSWRQADAS